jgi:hypothetical protein
VLCCIVQFDCCRCDDDVVFKGSWIVVLVGKDFVSP